MKFTEISDKIFEDEYNQARLDMAGSPYGEDLENAARAEAIFAVAKIHAAYNWAVYKKNPELLPPEFKEAFAEFPDVMAMAEQSKVNKGDSSSVTPSVPTAQEETVLKDTPASSAALSKQSPESISPPGDFEKIKPRAFKHSIFWQSGLSCHYNGVIPNMLYRFIEGDVNRKKPYFVNRDVLIIGLETILTAPFIFERGARRIAAVDPNKDVVALTRLNLKEVAMGQEWVVEQARSFCDIAETTGIKGRQFDSILLNLKYSRDDLVCLDDNPSVINEALASLRPLLRQDGSIFFFVSTYYSESQRYWDVGRWSISLRERDWLSEIIDEDSEFLIDCDQFLLIRISQVIFSEALEMPERGIIRRIGGSVVSLPDSRLAGFMRLCKKIPIKNKFKPSEDLEYSKQEDLDLPDLYYIGSGYSRGPTIGFTGTRTVKHYLIAEFTRSLAKVLSKNKVIVAACFVPGIDMEAHLGAMAANGVTVAAVPDILDWPYFDFDGWAGGSGREDKVSLLERRSLVTSILRNGCFISEHAIKQNDSDEVRHRNVYKRDRIVSGLSDVVIVVEGDKDGGTVDTGLRALLQGKIVYLIDWRKIRGMGWDKINKGAFGQLEQLRGLLLSDRELSEFGSRIKIFPSRAINSSDWEVDLMMEIMKELQHDCQLQPFPDPRWRRKGS